MPYYDISAEKDADAYLRMKESMEDDLPSSHFVEEAHADQHALAELKISWPGRAPLTCIVSATESPILYSDTKMQISTKSPIGEFISKNLSNLKVGMPLPNGATVLEIISPKQA